MNPNNDLQEKLQKTDRRQFIKVLSAGSMGALATSSSLGSCASKQENAQEGSTNTKKKVLMKLGCQYGSVTEENLSFNPTCH